ncbi:PH domain-containing protein [Methanoregula sp.]|uniref:PH domain-containing protein n=1 Tax=Methanoregula sp. TaxID=2052170 RepID=UPI0023702553|nr:PH domain-containing protein [Methanoregula sp.]MDD1685495.1 PH domain-containing protein [Methanoregula sp.]
MAPIAIYLVIACVAIRWLLDGMYLAASSAVSSSIPSLAPAATTGSVAGYPDVMTQYTSTVSQYSNGINDSAALTILFIAPIGIFLAVIAAGWAMRNAAMWTGPFITLGLSAITAFVLTHGSAGPEISGTFISVLLQWIAFLVQPFSIVATVIVLATTEKFRQSITYTITSNGIYIRGGVWKRQEHMIPHHQIGRVVLEQDFLGARYNYGTVIAQSITRWGAETSFRGVGASGQKDNLGVGIGYAKGREEASRYPLDCLFGIPDPQKARQMLETFMCRPMAREEEQIAYLKKIYESHAGMPGPGQVTRPTAPGGNSSGTDPTKQPGAVTWITEEDLPDSCACVICGRKELPHHIGSDRRCYCHEHISTVRKENRRRS